MQVIHTHYLKQDQAVLIKGGERDTKHETYALDTSIRIYKLLGSRTLLILFLVLSCSAAYSKLPCLLNIYKLPVHVLVHVLFRGDSLDDELMILMMITV